MSSEKPLLVVLGSTGNQGGSVLSYFLSLSPRPYTLRGVTRDLSSPKAVSLAALGVEMVVGDFDNPSSLTTAFSGASIIFSVTDFWQNFANPAQREKASTTGQGIGVFSRELEAQQNKNIIDAAAKISTLERFVFSSLPNTNTLSKGKYAHVFHFEGKAMAEEYGKLTYPQLWEKTSVFYAGYYLENYFGPNGALFRPKLVRLLLTCFYTLAPLNLYTIFVLIYYQSKDKNTLILSVANPLATAPLPMYSAVTDTGPLIHALLLTAPGKKLIGVNEWLSMRDFGTLLAEVLGKKIVFVDRNPNFDMGDPDLEKDHADMIGFCLEFGFDGGKVDRSVVRPEDLGVVVGLGSVREWIGGRDWEGVLEIE